jgi:hypothetical protein
VNRLRLVVRSLAALLSALLFVMVGTGVAAAHEERDVAGYSFAVGFIDEPVFVGQRSGLEFFVNKGTTPVDGLEKTLKAEVSYQGQKRELPISARDDTHGTYESVFIPTAAGPYTFHIFGSIEGTSIDESFTSSPTGFDEVQDTTGGQFPVQFPPQAEVVDNAQAGKDAGSQVTIALALGAAGVVIGLVAVGLALAGRRRAA